MPPRVAGAAKHSHHDRHPTQVTAGDAQREHPLRPLQKTSNPWPRDSQDRASRRAAGHASPLDRARRRGPLRGARGRQRRLLERVHGRRHGGGLVGRGDRAGDGRMAALPRSGRCAGRRRVPCRALRPGRRSRWAGRATPAAPSSRSSGRSATWACSCWSSSRRPERALARGSGASRWDWWSSPDWPSAAASSRRSAAIRSSARSCRPPPAGSATRSATGTASPRRWRSPSCSWSGWGATPGPPRLRAAAVAAIPLPILVIYLASSRGGVWRGVAGLAVLLAIGPARARMFAGLAHGRGRRGAAALAREPPARVGRRAGNSTAAAQGDQMLAISIAVVLAVGVLRFMLDDPLEELDVPARVTRAVAVGAVVVAIAGILVAGPAKRWEEFKQVGAARDPEHLCRGPSEQRPRKRPLSVLVGGARRLQGASARRHRRGRL